MTHKVTAFIVVEAKRERKGRELPPLTARSAPHYFEKSIPSQFILKEQMAEIDGVPVDIAVKTYHPYALLISGTFVVPDIFKYKEEDLINLKDKVHDLCYGLAKNYGSKEDIAEEYAIYQISGYEGDPELFLASHGQKIASLLKSEKNALDDKEIEYTLSHQIKYGEDDVVIIDWDGAFIFDPKGEIGETVEMLELGNYQLLRYRLLDASLDEQMQKALNAIEAPPRKKSFFEQSEFRNEFLKVIKTRAGAVSKFEDLERDIKLIGEWYSARLYDLIAKKFRLNEWRQTVREKLASLEGIYSIASEKLGMSRIHRLELVQIFGFFLLQFGWFVLIVLEFINITQK
jgi:hypothetical protein